MLGKKTFFGTVRTLDSVLGFNERQQMLSSSKRPPNDLKLNKHEVLKKELNL